MSNPKIKLTQAKEGAKENYNEVPFGTFNNGRTILFEEPIWFFIIVILFFLSSGSAVALGLYGMYQWESGETYSTDGLDTATYVCSAFALVFLLIIIITYMVLSFKKSLRVDENVLGEKFNSLHARFLASGAYKQIVKEFPDHARNMLIEDRENLRQYLEKNYGDNKDEAYAEAARREAARREILTKSYDQRTSKEQNEAEDLYAAPEDSRGNIVPGEGGQYNPPPVILSTNTRSPISLSRPRRYNPPLKKKKPSPSSKKRKSPSKKKSSSSKKKSSPSSKKKVASSKRK